MSVFELKSELPFIHNWWITKDIESIKNWYFIFLLLGIPVIADLPVGENLQDHYGTGALAFTVDQPVTLVQTRYENIPSVLKYAMFGSGPLTVLGGVEGMAWIPTKYENRSKDWPDIEFHFVSGSLGSDGGRQVRTLNYY